MKHLKRFNESQSEEITLTMDDVRKLKHNLNYGNKPDSFMSKYGWEEDDTLTAIKYGVRHSWNGKKVLIYNLYSKYGKLGYAILVGSKIEYLIGISKPYLCDLDYQRGVVRASGYDETGKQIAIKLWLDNGEFETIDIDAEFAKLGEYE